MAQQYKTQYEDYKHKQVKFVVNHTRVSRDLDGKYNVRIIFECFEEQWKAIEDEHLTLGLSLAKFLFDKWEQGANSPVAFIPGVPHSHVTVYYPREKIEKAAWTTTK